MLTRQQKTELAEIFDELILCHGVESDDIPPGTDFEDVLIVGDDESVSFSWSNDEYLVRGSMNNAGESVYDVFTLTPLAVAGG